MGDDLLGAEECTDVVTGLDHLGRLGLGQAELLDHDGGGHMVEVDQPAVVELSWQVGTADPELAGDNTALYPLRIARPTAANVSLSVPI